jgi:mannosyltransferase
MQSGFPSARSGAEAEHDALMNAKSKPAASRHTSRRCVTQNRLGLPDSCSLLGRLTPPLVLVLAAAIARFSLIDHQSLWFDEIVSRTLVKQPLAPMLHAIARTESTPPLYYVLLWPWIRVFGTSSAALRSLSACFGVLTVMVLYATARLRFSRSAAFVAGALAATHPMLIWYSQEARAYSLLTLLVSLSLYFFMRAKADGSMRNLAAWAISAAFALATHYFAAFVVFPEAALLAYLLRGKQIRRPLAATALLLAAGAALLPLALHQHAQGHANFIETTPLKSRIYDTVRELLIGRWDIPKVVVGVAYAVLLTMVVLSIARRSDRREQGDMAALLILGLTALLLPIVLTPNLFFHRNLIGVLPPVLLVAGLAFSPPGATKRAVAIGCVAAAALVIPTVVIAERRSLQREDWRGIAARIGAPDPSRAILAFPRFEAVVLSYYRPRLKIVQSGTLSVDELVLVGRPGLDTLRLTPGFRRVDDQRLGTLRILRLRSSGLRRLDVDALHLRPALQLLRPEGFEREKGGQDATLLVDDAAPHNTRAGSTP